VTILAEATVEATVAIIIGDDSAATLACSQALFCAFRAEIEISVLIVGRFAFRQFLAAVFTNNRFHNSRVLLVKGPRLVEADE